MKKQNLLTRTLLLFALIVGSTNVWADYEEVYNFIPYKPSSGAVSDYTKTGTMTIDDIKWTVPGNWYGNGALRIGGKSLSNVDRTITGQDAIPEAVSKITFNHGGVTSTELTVNSVTVTVASDAGFTSIVDTRTVNSPTVAKNTDGSFDITPTSGEWPANSYYKFAINVSNSKSSNYAFVVKSIVFYKQDATVKHTLSSNVYPANAGTVTLGATEVGEGKTTAISAEAVSGYAFSSWTVSGTGSSVENENAASTTFTMGTENATVTANFVEINYWVVTYDYNDGVTANEEVQVLKADAATYTLKAAPTRESYNFTGWKIGETTYDAGDAYEPTGNITVQAQWEWDGTLITYNKSNKNDIATGAKYIMVGSYTSNNVTTWKFATEMGSNTYLSATIVGEHGTLDADKAELFDETPEIITLNETTEGWTMTTDNGMIGIDGDKKIYYDKGDMTWDLGGTDDVPTFSATYNSSDYTMQFNWNSGNSRFTGYTSSQKVAYFYRLDNGKDVYTLTLDFNDGATADGAHRVLEGAEYTLVAPTRTDYIFMGWNTEEDGTGTSYAAGAYTMPAAATTLYAQWQPEEVDITVDAKGYASLCSAYALDFSAATSKAYIAKVEGNVVKMTAVTKVPAGKGIIVKGEAESIPTYTGSDFDDFTDNELVGVLENTTVTANTVSVLSEVDGVEGFYKFAGTTIPAGKAYLNAVATAARGFSLVFDDGETTGITSTAMQPSTEPYYDLQGRRVAQPTRGLYIVNGKKVVIR